MSAKLTKSNLARIKRALERKFGKQLYERTSNGMYKIPASEVLPYDDGGRAGFIARNLWTRYEENRFESVRKVVLGKNYVPAWELEPEARQKWFDHLIWLCRTRLESRDDFDEVYKSSKAKKARLLKRRRKAERDSGRPVAFLLPFNPIVLHWYLGREKNPRFDKRITVKELIPVYKDGTVGDPKHYPIRGPF